MAYLDENGSVQSGDDPRVEATGAPAGGGYVYDGPSMLLASSLGRPHNAPVARMPKEASQLPANGMVMANNPILEGIEGTGSVQPQPATYSQAELWKRRPYETVHSQPATRAEAKRRAELWKRRPYAGGPGRPATDYDKKFTAYREWQQNPEEFGDNPLGGNLLGAGAFTPTPEPDAYSKANSSEQTMLGTNGGGIYQEQPEDDPNLLLNGSGKGAFTGGGRTY